MNLEIGTEVEQFPEKKYINEIFVAVCGIHVFRKTALYTRKLQDSEVIRKQKKSARKRKHRGIAAFFKGR
jgi:hypothetical protein